MWFKGGLPCQGGNNFLNTKIIGLVVSELKAVEIGGFKLDALARVQCMMTGKYIHVEIVRQ